MSYAEDLKSVEWQKKRLSILTRDNWTCQLCKDKDTQFHIHHQFYLKDKKAWEYEDADLITYCKHCHALVEIIKSIKEIQAVLQVLKYTRNKETVIYAIVTDIQNQTLCCLFNYDERDNSIEFAIGIPEHIIGRINFEMELIKQQKNA